MEGMVFKSKAIVTAMNPYNFTTEDKREMTGVSVEYLMTEDLNPCSDEKGASKGIKVMKDSLDYDKKDGFPLVPGVYELSFKMMPARNGKPQLKVVNAGFIGTVEMKIKTDVKF